MRRKETNPAKTALSAADALNESLQKVVNSHGHGLHYAVIREMERLSNSRRFPWHLAGVEVPVIARGQDTRIDIVLRHHHHPVFLVCECKRVILQFGHQERLPLVLTDVVHGQDVGVVECRNGARFLLKAAQLFRILAGPVLHLQKPAELHRP